jgi:uncharacterized protein YggL (DUF469 family)
MSKTLNRRQRKKLYVNEFAVHGFTLTSKLNCASEEELNVFFDQLLVVLESRELGLTGSANTKEIDAFISSRHRYISATTEDIAALKTWFESNAATSDVVVSELLDANYGA